MSTSASHSSDEVRTHYVVEGEGAWVVLIHGVGLDLGMWARQAVDLERRYRVLRYDLIGHGATPAAGESLSLTDLVRQLRELLKALGIERSAVIGFSLGAMVAQAFTLAHASMVERLVLLNGVYARSEEARASVRKRLSQVRQQGIGSTIDASITRWFTDDFRKLHPDEVETVRNRLSNNDAAGFLPAYRLFADADRELAGRLNHIRVPTLVVTGEHDAGSTPGMAKKMSEEISGAQLRIVSGVRHMLPIEGAAVLNALLESFLSGEDKK